MLVKRLLPPETFHEYKADLRIVLLQPDGTERSVIEFKSGDNPDSIRGFGVNFAIMDEAARCPYESFISLLTTTTQTRGKILFISTPKGRDWFWEIYQRGEKFFEDGTAKFGPDEKDEFSEWKSIRMPSWANPTVKLETIREMKRNLPDDVFRQEVGAQFLLDSAGVFRGVSKCIKGNLQDPIAGRRYVIGADLARLRDYTVLTVMDVQNRHVVAFDRFNKVDWTLQYHRIIELSRRYNRATVVMDSTGIGDPIVEAVQGGGVHVDPYKISSSVAKQQLIDNTRVAIEKQTISFPYIPQLKREMEAYEYEISESGKVKFSAPAGQHDDCVISLALAVHGLESHQFKYTYHSVRGI